MAMVPKSKPKRQAKSPAAGWHAVTAETPCGICGKEDWCSRSTDGRTALCHRILAADARPGFFFKGLKTDKNGVRYAVWQRSDSNDKPNTLDATVPIASVEDRDVVYRALLQELPLSEQHRKQLNARGLNDKLIPRGWYSTWNRKSHPPATKRAIQAAIAAADEHEIDILTVPGFSEHNRDVVFRAAYGLLIPGRTEDGSIAALQVRLDKPNKNQGKYVYVSSKKYGGPSPCAMVHLPAFAPVHRDAVRITEGVLKADVATAYTGTLTISVPGVQLWQLALPVLHQLKPKRVFVAFYADWRTNRVVAECYYNLIGVLRDAGYVVIVETWEEDAGKGIDDLLAAGGSPTKLCGPEVTEFRQNLENLHGEFPPLNKVRIELNADRHVINELAANAMSRSSRLYRYAGEVVRIQSQTPHPSDYADENKDPPKIILADATLLTDELSRHAQFLRWNERKDEFVRADPPDPTVRFLYANGDKYPLRKLNGVVSHPVLRADGSLFNLKGYDTRTGMYLDRPVQSFELSDSPTKSDVRRAVQDLRTLVADFPFAEEAGFSAWLSLPLTLLTRHLYSGNTPLYLAEATKSGTGKGLLIDIPFLIVAGEAIGRSSFPDSEAEICKTITSHILEGHQALLFDNIKNRVDSASLEAALTSKWWCARLLGVNRTMRARMNLLFILSANNPYISPDIARRTLSLRMQTDVERPDLRDDFQISDIEKWTLEHRPELLGSLLTIVRAYILAGCPQQKLPRWGSFGAWSDLNRQIIVWCGCPDPADVREPLRKRADTESLSLASLLAGLESAQMAKHLPRDFTARNLVKWIEVAGANEVALSIKDALFGLRPKLAQPLVAATVGKVLAGFDGNIAGGRRLMPAGENEHTKRWNVEQAAKWQ